LNQLDGFEQILAVKFANHAIVFSSSVGSIYKFIKFA